MKKIITLEEANMIGNMIDINRGKHDHEKFSGGHIDGLDKNEFKSGITESNVDLILTGKVVLADLDEESVYLCNLHNDAEKTKVKPVRNRYAADATADSIVDAPFTETYGSNHKEHRDENRRDNKKILLND